MGLRPARSAPGLRGLFLFLLLLVAMEAWGHPANVPTSLAKVSPNGTFTLRIRFDAIAFATGVAPKDADDGVMTALIDGPEDALRRALSDSAGRFRRGLIVRDGGQIDALDYPTVASVRRFLAGDPSPRLPMMLEAIVRGHLAPGARRVSFQYPETFDTVIQTVEFPYQEPISEPVAPGAVSAVLAIPTEAETARRAAEMNAPRAVATPPVPAPTVAKVPPPAEPRPESPVTKPAVTPSAPPKNLPKLKVAPKPMAPVPVVTSDPPPPPAAATSPLVTYLQMGFTHILPQGIDHILFVLGLFLLGTNTKALVKQITAFTIAHSITLALATLGYVHLPGRIIEPVIAISIAFVAIENLVHREVKPWRIFVVFAFGLVHGLGFAEVFVDAGLRGSGLLTALLSFNLGVEGGQLTVVAAALVAVGWFRKDRRYRPMVVVPASLAIAALALVWTAQRILT